MAQPDLSHAAAAPSRSLLLAAGLVLLVQGFSLFATMAVLGNAIQWPDMGLGSSAFAPVGLDRRDERRSLICMRRT